MPRFVKRAAIFDTNFIGGQGFKLAILERFVTRLDKREIGCFVPEVVLWEWAQHAEASMHALQSDLRRAKNSIDPIWNVAVPIVSGHSIEILLARLRKAVEALPVDIIEADTLDPDDALKQQVLQTGTGSTKKGIKTGAADALIVQAVLNLLDDYDEVALATGDRDLAAACPTDDRVRILRHAQDFWEWYATTPPSSTPPDDSVLRISLTNYIENEFVESLAQGQGLPLFDGGVDIDRDIVEYAGFETQDVRQTDVDVQQFRDVELRNVQIVSGDDLPRLIAVHVSMAATVDITNWHVGGTDGKLFDEYAVLDVDISAPITVELDEDWDPTSFSTDDSANMSLSFA